MADRGHQGRWRKRGRGHHGQAEVRSRRQVGGRRHPLGGRKLDGPQDRRGEHAGLRVEPAGCGAPAHRGAAEGGRDHGHAGFRRASATTQVVDVAAFDGKPDALALDIAQAYAAAGRYAIGAPGASYPTPGWRQRQRRASCRRSTRLAPAPGVSRWSRFSPAASRATTASTPTPRRSSRRCRSRSGRLGALAADRSLLTPEDEQCQRDVHELAAAVYEPLKVAPRGRVRHRRGDLDQPEAGSKRPDGEPDLDAVARREGPDGRQARARERALSRQRRAAPRSRRRADRSPSVQGS